MKPPSNLILLKEQFSSLFVIRPIKRPTLYLVMAAFAVGLPTLVGAAIDQFAASINASMGGLIILYLRQTKFTHRMITMGLCAFGMTLSFTLGLLTSFHPVLSAFTLLLSVFLVTVICRYYALPPPGTFFFIVAACIGRTIPFDIALVAERIGVLMFGSMSACLVALLYSVIQVYFLKQDLPDPPPKPDSRIDAIIIESAIIALVVAGSYLFARSIGMENPYWVPISCAAILQGATFREIWHRNVHRIFGTAVGLVLTWAIFSLSPSNWMLAICIIVLSFLIEYLVTRNYGLAVIFITPLTVIYADSALYQGDANLLLVNRLADITLGSIVGYLGGWLIHRTATLTAIEAWLSRWRHHTN